MADPVSADPTDKPLNPAMARLETRVRTLMLIGGLTLGIGLAAVFAAIIYRVAVPSDKGAGVAEATAAPAPSPADSPAIGSPAPAPAGSASPEASSSGASSPGSVARAVERTREVLPVRAWLVSTAVSGDRIVLAYEHAGGTTMFVVDAASLEITGRLDLKPKSP